MADGGLQVLKRVLAFFMGGATLIPGAHLLMQEVPPLYRLAAALSAFVAIAVTWLAFKGRILSGARLPTGLAYLVFAVILHVGYMTALEYWTVTEGGERIAIGFGLAEWSLTDKGQQKLAEIAANPSTHELMLRVQFEASSAWHSYTIIAASIMLLMLFALSLWLWAAGWGIIAAPHDPKTQAIETINNNAREGMATTIKYRDPSSASEEAFAIEPVSLVMAMDGLVLRARDLGRNGTIRHFLMHRVRCEQSSKLESTTIEELSVTSRVQCSPSGTPDPKLRELIGIIRDILADFRVEQWERARFEQATARLGLDNSQVRAACAMVLAEHLMGLAATGSIDDSEMQQIVRLSRGLQMLADWLSPTA